MNLVIFINIQYLLFFTIIQHIFILKIFETISFSILIITNSKTTLNIIFKNIYFLNKSQINLIVAIRLSRTIFGHAFYHHIIIKGVIICLTIVLRRIIFLIKIKRWFRIAYIRFFIFIFYKRLTSNLCLLLLLFWSTSAFWSYKLLLPSYKRIVRFHLNLISDWILVWKWWISTSFNA